MTWVSTLFLVPRSNSRANQSSVGRIKSEEILFLGQNQFHTKMATSMDESKEATCGHISLIWMGGYVSHSWPVITNMTLDWIIKWKKRWQFSLIIRQYQTYTPKPSGYPITARVPLLYISFSSAMMIGISSLIVSRWLLSAVLSNKKLWEINQKHTQTPLHPFITSSCHPFPQAKQK